MLSPIGNSYGYYTSSPYATGHTAAAAHTALVNSNHDSTMEVQAVSDIPEVFSNDETERVQRTPDEVAQDRRNTYEIMNSLNPRNAEHLNAPLEFMAKRPFEQGEYRTLTKKQSIEPSGRQTLVNNAPTNAFKSSYQTGRNSYETQQMIYNAFVYNNNGGFHAMA